MALSDEQKAIRATGIGGSEIAAVVGLNPWMRPIDVYQRKLGIAAEPSGHHIERGNHLEPALRSWYAERTGRSVVAASTLRHPKHPHVLATPDGLSFAQANTDLRTLELKAPGFRTAAHWGEAGTDEVPEYYLPQLMLEAACAGALVADAAALIDGDLRVYSVAYNHELAEVLCEAAEKFWHDHIEPRVPPPIDGSASYSEYLAKQFPRSLGYLRPAGAREEMLAESLRGIRSELAELERRKTEVENHLKSFIGEADGLEGPWGRITWRQAKESARTDWKAVAAELGAPVDVVAKHTETKPGSRRFVVPRSWDKEQE